MIAALRLGCLSQMICSGARACAQRTTAEPLVIGLASDAPVKRNMEIRVGTADDIDAAATIWENAHRERVGFVPEGARKERASAFLADRIALSTSRFLVCEIDGAVVGMLFARQARTEDGAGDPIPGLLHISYVAVAPSFWGNRIGAILI